MTYVKINDVIYLATINGELVDGSWANRESKAITLEMDHATASEIFVDGLAWSILCDGFRTVEQTQEDGTVTVSQEHIQEEYDNSEYAVAGPITDNRDGTVTVKMGKKTDGEMLAELMEVLNNE